MTKHTRRAILAAAGVALAGCAGDEGETGGNTTNGQVTTTAHTPEAGGTQTDQTQTDEGTSGTTNPSLLPLSDETLHVGWDRQTLRENIVSGGPGKDGIPSIDQPKFVDASTADQTLGDASRVIGIVVDGDARAYPHRILVWHEIANDVVGGIPLSITYCPLTGTALGFERGETTFGVSGRLVNNNLVMYDRATDSWWPQITGTAIRGELKGEFLREVPLAWTKWDRWKRAHPDTKVLSEDTGYIRSYGDDPYGRDYYSSGPPLFEPIATSDRFEPKTTVLGARGTESAICVRKAFLESERIVQVTVDGGPAVAVFDDPLDTGYVYRNPDEKTVTASGDQFEVDGQTYDPAALPLPRMHAFEAMWFAWYGLYPDTAVYG